VRVEALDFLVRLGALGVRLNQVATQTLNGLVDLVTVVSTENLGEIGFFVRMG
jgi:hypothetical protein